MAGLGQLLQQFPDGSDGSDSDDGSFSAGSDSDSASGSSDASTQESNLSQFTAPPAEEPESAAEPAEETDADDAAPGDDAAAAEAAAAKAERIAAEPSPEPAPKKARPAAKAPADPGAGCSDAAIRAYLGRWHPSQRNKLTKRLERLLNRLEEPDSGVEAAATDGFDLPERSTDTGPKYALFADGKVVTVFKKGPFGKFDFKACKEPSEAFTEQARATFGKKKRKAPAPAGGQAAKRPASVPAAGPATKIDSIFNKSGAAAVPAPAPAPESAAAGAGIVPGPAPKPQTADAATDPMPEPAPKPAPKPAPVVARAPSAPPDPQVPAVAGGTTEVPASLYFTKGDSELVPRQGDDGSVVGFDAVRSTRKARGRSRAALLSFPPQMIPADPARPTADRRCSLTPERPRRLSTTRSCGCRRSTRRRRSCTLWSAPPPPTRRCRGRWPLIS